MSNERSELVRVPDQEALQMLDVLASNDLRTLGLEAAYLIREAYARRFSQPNPVITVEDAQRAKER